MAGSRPIFFFEPPHRRRARVLDLEPVVRAPGTIGRTEPRRYGTLTTERAGVLVDGRAIAVEVLIEGDAVMRQPRQPSEAALAVFDRLAAHVVAVHFKQNESALNRSAVGAVTADQIEHGKPIVVTAHRLAVDDTRTNGQRLDRLADDLIEMTLDRISSHRILCIQRLKLLRCEQQ